MAGADMTVEREVAMRVTLLKPPAGVAFCLRAKDDDLIDRIVATGDDISFDFTMRVKRVDGSGQARFLGRFALGPPASPFVYIGSGTFAGQSESSWSRRAKIALAGITWNMIERALGGRTRLDACVVGETKDGGPLCATVSLLDGGWRIADPRGPPPPTPD